MSSGVSVDSSAVEAGIRCCDTSVKELEDSARGLQDSYNRAGDDGWRDAKYVRLGEIITECTNALQAPVSELQECKKKLEELLRHIQAYEQNNL